MKKNENTISRRKFLNIASAAIGATAVANTTTTIIPSPAQNIPDKKNNIPPYGKHQQGIVTSQQKYLHFATYDTLDITQEELKTLLQNWTQLSNKLCAKNRTHIYNNENSPPNDTGETLGISPKNLTITFGFGPELFEKNKVNRFGLKNKCPRNLKPLPRFPRDNLNPNLSGGDLCIQVCSENPQTNFHAIRNLTKIAFKQATLKWSQTGFLQPPNIYNSNPTPRNLFGFKDGTNNIDIRNNSETSRYIWVQDSDKDIPEMRNGTYLVTRKIRMTIETWDHATLKEQERVIGRKKSSGAPLSGGIENSDPKFEKVNNDNMLYIDPQAHIRIAHPDNINTKILRRGYNYTDSNDLLGKLDAGLFFMCFQKNPETQFTKIQNQLSQNDELNEYIQHVSSGIFAIPPGTTKNQYIGEKFFT